MGCRALRAGSFGEGTSKFLRIDPKLCESGSDEINLIFEMDEASKYMNRKTIMKLSSSSTRHHDSHQGSARIRIYLTLNNRG